MGSTVYGSSDAPALDSLMNDTYFDESLLSVEQKKRKDEDSDSNTRRRDECQYEIIKFKK